MCVSMHCRDKQIFCMGIGVYFILHDLSSTVSNLCYIPIYINVFVSFYTNCVVFFFFCFFFVCFLIDELNIHENIYKRKFWV